jgi:hypothetical protein
MLVELIEPGTSLSDPFSLHLKMPNTWSEHLRDFLMQSDVAEGECLVQVSPATFTAKWNVSSSPLRSMTS